MRATAPLQASAADARLAAQYNITISELAPLNSLIAATTVKLNAIDAEAKALYDQANRTKTALPQAKLNDLNARRYLTVMAGVSSMRKTLSAPSWNNMRGFINNEFRNTTHAVR